VKCVFEVRGTWLTCSASLRDCCGAHLSSLFGGSALGESGAAVSRRLCARIWGGKLDRGERGSEEGEIVEKPADRPAEVKKHPLEHSWTFWFDNPNGKQKQATWGSSLRPVYTFHTVEEFWWYVALCPVPAVGVPP
jgi:hypothetical protein